MVYDALFSYGVDEKYRKSTVSSLTCSPMSYRGFFGRKFSGARYYNKLQTNFVF